jgi:hypothetical protein
MIANGEEVVNNKAYAPVCLGERGSSANTSVDELNCGSNLACAPAPARFAIISSLANRQRCLFAPRCNGLRRSLYTAR